MAHHAAEAHHEGQVGHVVPVWLLAAVLFALLALTWLTVAVRAIDLGPFNVVVAVVIATVKAVMVALYFMHLRWDRPFNGVVFLASVMFVGLLILLSSGDTLKYRKTIDWQPAPGLQRQ